VTGPTLDELRFLACAVRLGSFSAAARELGVTQQAVSARVRELERRLGFRLVLRASTGVTPTDLGLAVLEPVEDVLRAADHLEERIAAIRGAEARPLRIAASQTIAAHLLPSWLLALRSAQAASGQPGTRAALSTANSTEVVDLVRAGEADLGFIETPEVPRDLGSLTVGLDRMVVAVAPGHPWALRAGVPLTEVAVTPLVSREHGSGTRAAYEDAVAQTTGGGSSVPAVIELATEAAVRSAVAEGVAPAVLSELTVRDDVALGRIATVPLLPAPIERPLTAVWRGARRDLSLAGGHGAIRELVAVARAAF